MQLLAGHVTIHNNAILGGLSAVHQFVSIGKVCHDWRNEWSRFKYNSLWTLY